MIVDWNNAVEEIIKKKYNRIYIYGAGRAGLLTFLFLQKKGIDIVGFIETNPSKRKVISVSKSISRIDETSFAKNDIVLIAILNFHTESSNSIKVNNNITISYINKLFFNENIQDYFGEINNILMKEDIISYRGRALEGIVYTREFLNEIDNSDYFVRVKKMLLGLDDNSKAIFLKSIERIRLLAEGKLFDDCFDEFEMMELIKSREYCSKACMVDEDMWELEGRFLPVNDFRGEIFYDRLGLDTISNLDRLKGKDIIDIGGYIGDSGLILSDYTQGDIYAFEPVFSYIPFIERTAQMNKRAIKAINLAASDKNGNCSFSIGEQVFNSTLQEVSGRNYVDEISVETITIDEFVAQRRLNIGLVKIHAEGAEQKVIRGAINTIKEQEPVIVIEINHTSSDLLDIKPMLEEMNKRYKFSIYKPANGFICMGEKLIAEVY